MDDRRGTRTRSTGASRSPRSLRDAIRRAARGSSRWSPHKPRRTEQAGAAGGQVAGRTAPTVLSRSRHVEAAREADLRAGAAKYQGELNLLQRRGARAGVSTILVFEGVDAAGKGGAIRRITAALDARDYQVIPIAAPTDEERAQHYLWRFWRHLARAGRVTIFDRSWYGRVLVERVERFATPRRVDARLRRDQPVRGPAGRPRHRAREVLAPRHEGRAAPPLQGPGARRSSRAGRSRPTTGATGRSGRPTSRPSTTWSSGPSTRQAPWTLVEGNDKYHARVRILQTACDRLRQAL